MNEHQISQKSLSRLPVYLNCVKDFKAAGRTHISAPVIASRLGLNQVMVRKDLSAISGKGKPKTGYVINVLIDDITRFLGYDNINSAIIVGAGHLGKALMSYDGFKEYGLQITAAFDNNKDLWYSEINGIKVYPLDKLSLVKDNLQLSIGIIAVPAPAAQEVCNLLIETGAQAIWNFAPTVLDVPDNILVQNENMASSLALLCNHLSQKLKS